MSTYTPRLFAPLKPGASSTAPKLRGVVFDMDGTLCEPQTYMFGQMRAALGITKSVDILDHIYELPTPEAQESALESIRAIEREAMAGQVAQPGLVQLMDYLDSRGLKKGICTRNFEAPVAHLLNKFLSGSVIEPVVTRDFRPPKPDPAGILHIAKSWGLTREDSGADEEADASQLLMVGDSIDDMTAGRRAGAATVLLVNDVNVHLADHEHTDLVIRRLDDLIPILEEGFKSRDTVVE
ncbi:HAD-like domain-containing protein [Plectosphaerella cucumerina]|uniref:HAD-like domain-containing protein n=1 Tax=Plectosphaerella cucumerina TaxID=40658 RepID=A0A8K0TH74_9PEZI|nr:HAD-like domain-containing protein [Plectosphaerella cucumerina]